MADGDLTTGITNFSGIRLSNITISTIYPSEGQGNIYLKGQGSSVGSTYGIYTSATLGPVLSTVGGNITLIGTSAGGSGSTYEGISLVRTLLESTGGGSIILNGTGGNATTNGGYNYGVAFWECNSGFNAGSGTNNAGVSLNTGTLTIVGQAGTTATGINCWGIFFHNSDIQSNGPISITGIGNSTSGIGVRLEDSHIASPSDIILNGTGYASGTSSYGIYSVGTTTISGSDYHDITLIGSSQNAKDIYFDEGTSIVNFGNIFLYNNDYTYSSLILIHTNSSLYISPLLSTSSIGIGNFATGTLSVNDSVLQQLFPNIGQLVIGQYNGTHYIQVGTISSISKPLILYGETIEMLSGGNTWTITDNNTGSILSSVLGGTIYFSNIENLTGGSGNDIFVLKNQKGISGTIDGDGGYNTLDYSDYSTPVRVDLNLGLATNIGHILNIQNVIFNQVKLNHLYFTLLFNTFYLKDIYLDDYDYMYDNEIKFYIRLKRVIWNKIFKNKLIAPILKIYPQEN